MTSSLISNPPYNIKWEHPAFAQMQPRFMFYDLPPESNANFAFVLSAMDMVSDKAVFILPNSVLTSNCPAESSIRKRLADLNLIEAVICCPGNMFEKTPIAVCVIVFNKNKKTNDTVFIDMREVYDTEQRDQRGQYGGKSHTGRTYTKEVKVFSAAHIDRILNTITNRTQEPGFSVSVPAQTIIENGGDLSPSTYIGLKTEGFTHRAYEEIIGDINRVVEEKNVLKLTINETIAKGLGLYDFAATERASKSTEEKISNDAEKLFGLKITKSDYIKLTKNKGEIKFENNNKERLSIIFASILQAYRQHILYLNNEENRYLAEYRDALLPDLMSGKLKLPPNEPA